FELNLRRELTLFRQAKQQGGSYQSSGFNLVVDNSSPLEAERKLLLLRWNFIQEQESGHHFDLTWLILYFLKLQILERLFSFDKDKGLVLFDQLSVARI
ncbi:MAG: DUF2764 domain-containing protein, partial [Candidatus Omnitrophica bacterium]|nr:DUF2764 domain-containing protein [Candidatus Omnitrophota bacterium]